jgi:hypothetical protein
MNANVFITKDYESETAFRPKKTNPKQSQFKPNPELAEALSAAEGAVEKFLSLWSESVTIIRKSVIRQFKRGRLGWLLLGTVTKRILEHSPVGTGPSLEIGYYVNAIFFGGFPQGGVPKDRF